MNENNSKISTNGENNFLDKYIPHTNIVFDVGANVGEWTERSVESNSNLSVHCFEPDPDAFAHIKTLFEKNPNIFLSNVAIGEQCKPTITFYRAGKGNKQNSLYLRDSFSNETETYDVKLIDLKHYCEQKSISKIDLLKIDVEGNDVNVLKGSKKLMESQSIKVIQIEYGGTYLDSRFLLKDIFTLAKSNYKVYLILPKKLKLIKFYDPKLENYKYKNFVLVASNFNKEFFKLTKLS
jgi:FkbM family methyltransferase